MLHDLAIPGSPANIDHLVIGPGGVLVIDSSSTGDSYEWTAMGWPGTAATCSSRPLRKVRWAANQADDVLGIADIMAAAIVALHGAGVPWGVLQADGVTIVPARRVANLLQALPPTLGPERVAWRPAAAPRRRLTARTGRPRSGR